MWRRVRDGMTAFLLSGFVLLEPPVVSDSTGKWSASITSPIHQWTFVSAFDVNTKCDQRRTDRLANAAGELGVDAESDRPGTKLGAIFDARRLSRCVSDDQFFTTPAPSK